MVTSEMIVGDNGWGTGGTTHGIGFCIDWQNGLQPPRNGAFVEDIIQAAIDRLEFFQSTKSANLYNAEALFYLKKALSALEARVADRIERGVYNSYEP